MKKHEEIKKYLEEIRNADVPFSEGGEAKAFFVDDDHILKVYKRGKGYGRGSSYKYLTKEDFCDGMEKVRETVEDLRSDGINSPQVLDYMITDGAKYQVALEERAKGNPVGVRCGTNLQGAENRMLIDEMRRYTKEGRKKDAEAIDELLTNRVIKYNLARQEELLDAPDDVLEKVIEDIRIVHADDKYKTLRLDAFSENLIYDAEKKEFSFIDFKARRARNGIDGGEIINDIIDFFAFSQCRPCDLKMGDLIWKNNDNLIYRLVELSIKNGILDYGVEDMVNVYACLMESVKDPEAVSEIADNIIRSKAKHIRI